LKAGMTLLRDRAGINGYLKIPSILNHLPRPRALKRWFLRAATRLPALRASQLQKFVSGYDLVLHAPQGPTIGHLYELNRQILLILDAAQRARRPTAMLGVSLGPFADASVDDQYIQDTLQAAQCIVVR